MLCKDVFNLRALFCYLCSCGSIVYCIKYVLYEKEEKWNCPRSCAVSLNLNISAVDFHPNYVDVVCIFILQ